MKISRSLGRYPRSIGIHCIPSTDLHKITILGKIWYQCVHINIFEPWPSVCLRGPPPRYAYPRSGPLQWGRDEHQIFVSPAWRCPADKRHALLLRNPCKENTVPWTTAWKLQVVAGFPTTRDKSSFSFYGQVLSRSSSYKVDVFIFNFVRPVLSQTFRGKLKLLLSRVVGCLFGCDYNSPGSEFITT